MTGDTNLVLMTVFLEFLTAIFNRSFPNYENKEVEMCYLERMFKGKFQANSEILDLKWKLIVMDVVLIYVYNGGS